VDADQRDALELGVPLDDLVRDARQRALDVFRIEDSLRFGGLRAQGALRALLTFYSFPASRDRVKGACLSVRDSRELAGRYQRALLESRAMLA
jgi:hypothetical protein